MEDKKPFHSSSTDKRSSTVSLMTGSMKCFDHRSSSSVRESHPVVEKKPRVDRDSLAENTIIC